MKRKPSKALKILRQAVEQAKKAKCLNELHCIMSALRGPDLPNVLEEGSTDRFLAIKKETTAVIRAAVYGTKFGWFGIHSRPLGIIISDKTGPITQKTLNKAELLCGTHFTDHVKDAQGGLWK